MQVNVNSQARSAEQSPLIGAAEVMGGAVAIAANYLIDQLVDTSKWSLPKKVGIRTAATAIPVAIAAAGGQIANHWIGLKRQQRNNNRK